MNWFIHGALHAIVHVAWLLAAAVAHGQVCQIRSADGRSYGSAVCVGTFDAGGAAVFLTAGHCCDTERVELAPEGRWLRGDVLAWGSDGPGRDLAFVRVADYRPSATYRLATASPAVGERVTMAGFPESGPFRRTSATVVRHGTGWTTVSAAGVQGVSGGPLLVGRTVVGIVTHNEIRTDRANATNAETIAATLKAWGLAEGKRTAAWIGVGAGMQCSPFGCYRPVVPVYPQPVVPVYPQPVVPYAGPVNPYYDSPYRSPPQRPAWPGWETPDETRPPGTPAKPAEPERNADYVGAIDALRDRIASSEANSAKALGELRAAIGALSLRAGEAGERGPPGERGPQGPQGPPGKDGAAADVSALRQRIERLEAAEIPVRILDGAGKTIDEKRYRLGEPLEFRLVPRSN